MKLLRALAGFIRWLTCRHYWIPVERKPGAHGVIIKRRCTKCPAIDYIHDSTRKGA